MYLCVSTQALTWACMWRPDVEIWCLPQLLSFTLFGDKVSTESRPLKFGFTNWPESSKNPPVPASWVIELECMLLHPALDLSVCLSVWLGFVLLLHLFVLTWELGIELRSLAFMANTLLSEPPPAPCGAASWLLVSILGTHLINPKEESFMAGLIGPTIFYTIKSVLDRDFSPRRIKTTFLTQSLKEKDWRSGKDALTWICCVPYSKS